MSKEAKKINIYIGSSGENLKSETVELRNFVNTLENLASCDWRRNKGRLSEPI